MRGANKSTVGAQKGLKGVRETMFLFFLHVLKNCTEKKSENLSLRTIPTRECRELWQVIFKSVGFTLREESFFRPAGETSAFLFALPVFTFVISQQIALRV